MKYTFQARIIHKKEWPPVVSVRRGSRVCLLNVFGGDRGVSYKGHIACENKREAKAFIRQLEAGAKKGKR